MTWPTRERLQELRDRLAELNGDFWDLDWSPMTSASEINGCLNQAIDRLDDEIEIIDV